MWVCHSDIQFIRYVELSEVPNTHLQPLILFASEEPDGDQRWFRGPKTSDDGTGHPRNYPVVLTFNFLTVKANEIVYNRSKRLVTAFGEVSWENGAASGTGDRVVFELVGSNPKPSN